MPYSANLGCCTTDYTYLTAIPVRTYRYPMQMCYISFLDYFVFTANCAFGKKVKHHMFFTDVSEYKCAPWPLMLCGAVQRVPVMLTTALGSFTPGVSPLHAQIALHLPSQTAVSNCKRTTSESEAAGSYRSNSVTRVRPIYIRPAVCLEMPHVLHMIIGCFTAVVFIAITAFMVVASCDLNPISKAHLASPAAYTRLKILMAKAVYVIATGCLDSILKVEVSLSAICVAIVIWWNFRSVSL